MKRMLMENGEKVTFYPVYASGRNICHVGAVEEAAEKAQQDKRAVGANQDLHPGTSDSSLPTFTFTLKTTQMALLFVYFRFNVPPQTQAAENEKAIRDEFDKLHNFLVEEERNRLKALRTEEEVKKQVMSEKLKTLTEQIQSLSATISNVEMTLEEKDLPFLMVCYVFNGLRANNSSPSVGFRGKESQFTNL